MYSRAYVEITNICNLRCSFCHGHSRAPRQLSREEFLHILDQLKGQTQYIYYHLMGEPLLHPQLPEFIRLAGKQGFFSVITTNGTLLQRHGAELLEAGLHKVSISLHSFEKDDPEGHLEYLEQVAAFAEQATQKGTLISLRLWNRGCDNGANSITEAVLRQRLPGQWEKNSRGYRLRDKVYLEYGNRFVWPDRENQLQEGRPICYGMRDHFGILSDGTVVPCCLDSDGVIALGNVFSQPLSEILSTERAKRIGEGFRNRTAVESLCQRCPYAQR